MKVARDVSTAGEPVLSVAEFHRVTGGSYRHLSDAEARAMIGALTVAAEIVCAQVARAPRRKRTAA